jgi:long-chain acyl-CoA synthetase
MEYRLEEDGEILLRGPTVFSGYLNLPEENSRSFTPDGYFRTGDVGSLDEDGFLTLTDRKKHLIKTSGGKYVAPARVASRIKDEPLVSQVYVHGDRRPYIVALITLDPMETGRVAAELDVEITRIPTHPDVLRRITTAVERSNDRLARFEQVKYHAVLSHDFSVDEQTLTPSLKLRRRAIEERYAAAIDELYESGSGS